MYTMQKMFTLIFVNKNITRGTFVYEESIR
ncbi:hypothetical protein M2137_000562 [Parabacteroides sp. PFB2-10]|nr:hypothetical protein [Parabacteroides sp. PFB2-10]